ncbi:MAG: hypothetical protein KKE11_05915 [Gammaproteobacteria bacterium]|nr:hypothetical protein [Gammaproteobacteria bacterium]
MNKTTIRLLANYEVESVAGGWNFKQELRNTAKWGSNELVNLAGGLDDLLDGKPKEISSDAGKEADLKARVDLDTFDWCTCGTSDGKIEHFTKLAD